MPFIIGLRDLSNKYVILYIRSCLHGKEYAHKNAAYF